MDYCDEYLKANTYYKVDNFEGSTYIHIKEVSLKSSRIIIDAIHVYTMLRTPDEINIKPTEYYQLYFNEQDTTQEEIISKDFVAITKIEYENMARLAIMKCYENFKSKAT